MLSLLFVAAVVALAVWFSRLARRSPRPRLGWPALWRLACLIGAVRIGALWVGNGAYRDSGWSQGLGYFLLMTGLPEIYLVRGARADVLKWLLLGSVLLAASSVVWAGLFVWLANRVRPAETR